MSPFTKEPESRLNRAFRSHWIHIQGPNLLDALENYSQNNDIQNSKRYLYKGCINDCQAFLRKYSEPFDGEQHQFILRATDETLSLLRYNGPVLIDATFRVGPAPFVQCLIVRVYDKGTDFYVPAT
ncbi:LOW QUALITY PROTEIN: hypothetical protein HZS_2244 [Henneguya salminicola]|nr:LOW QUALITY PROTEIN: hypothetical protein HZS_2244 [Henneguya salminicola]